MEMKWTLRASVLLLLGGWLPGAASAGVVNFAINVDTSLLTAGPYYVEFQLTDGDGVPSNLVHISNFNFFGGSAFGLPTVTGGATGDLGSTVDLVDSSFFTSFYQAFNPGTNLTFMFGLTANSVGVTPDQFSFAILNSSIFEVPTLGPAGEIFSADLFTPLVYNVYPGDTNASEPTIGAVTVTPLSDTPEAGSLVMLTSALATLGALRLRKRACVASHLRPEV